MSSNSQRYPCKKKGLPPFLPDMLTAAHGFGQAGRFPQLAAVCRRIIASHGDNSNALLDAGALLLNAGLLTGAQECFERAQALDPSDVRPVINLANLAKDSANHAECRRLYTLLLDRLPNHPIIRRNAVVSLEYDPTAADTERLQAARDWGNWAAAQAGGLRQRPPMPALVARPLRIGYVSPDLCQHTVGLFLKDVLATHAASGQVTVFAYGAGHIKDWVNQAIRAACLYRDVSSVNDVQLAEMIRQDAIDVLIDLSGHTAGSRLAVFAYRPAPVQVSWLGYFATTGLSCIDAVLLDDWHAPEGTEVRFIEPIIRLPQGRLCYQPVPWAPSDVAPLPSAQTGTISFGSFNNTGKYNSEVFDLWARILATVPNSRLVLKWRTFNDAGLRQSVTEAFARRGIAPERTELRGPSFHADLLKEYGDIDIALDPFPFTGGLTSCEALWMGVPVVTWPQSRVVSRQTLAFLSSMGLSELAARDADDYVRIATALARDPKRLLALRTAMRATMQTSPLMGVARFTQDLERTLIDLYRSIRKQEQPPAMTRKSILHVGPGHRKNGAQLPQALQGPRWREIRLDIDPTNEPDIVGSMLDMAAVPTETVDALYSAHNIEHVYAHEVPRVLTEFYRVLHPEGFVVLTCPDLQSVCALVAEDKLTEPAYHSPAGPITPLDMLYGHGAALADGHHFMAHKCGFTLSSLTTALQAAGFQTVAGKRRARGFDLWVVATKIVMAETDIRELAMKVLPA